MRFQSGTVAFLTFTLTLFLTFILITVASDSSAEEPEYHPYDEVMADYENVASAHPDIAQFINLSEEFDAPLTYGNHSIHAMRITDQDEDPLDSSREPAILITSIHHAREWISVEVTTYFMHYLVDNYGTDPYVTYLVDNRDIWIIPFVNPDGYLQSWAQNDREKNKTGWRKNIRDNNGNGVIDGDDGVDLNRNYGYEWGYDSQGSSGDPSGITYRGPAPFSEPETQSIRTLCNAVDFTMVIHYHSYGNQILYPWAYDKIDTPDHEIFVKMGEQMSRYNGYEHGNTKDGIIYKCNGESCDWHYGEKGSFAFTIELGYNNEGYIPDESRILPICEENLQVNLFTCYIADDPDKLLDCSDPEPGSDGSDTWFHQGPGDLWEIRNEGIVGEASWYIEVGTGAETHAELELKQNLTLSDNVTVLRFWEKYDISLGSTIGVYLKDSSGGLTRITDQLGEPGGSRGAGEAGGTGGETDTRGEAEGEGEGKAKNTRRGEDTRGSGDQWTLVYYNLTPYLDSEPQTVTFVMESSDDMAGDHWSVDGVTIAAAIPSEFIRGSGGQGGEGDENFSFSITPENKELTKLPDTQETFTVDIHNEVQENTTIEFSAESDPGWEIEITFGGSEVDEVFLSPDKTITLNITITIPSEVEAEEVGVFTILFWSQENTSQNLTMDIEVTIEAFYHITLENPGTNHFLPGEKRTLQFTLHNLGNSQIDIDQEYDLKFGNDDGWTFTFGEDPVAGPYSDTLLQFSITPPGRIEAHEEISIEVKVKIIGHSSGDGTDAEEFFLIIDEVEAGGFASLDSPTAKPGEENAYNVLLHNLGNVQKTFFISLQSAWDADISRDSAEIDPYSYIIVVLTLTPPTDINSGESGIVNLRIDNPIQNSTTITFTSTASYKVGISTSKLNHTIPAGREKEISLSVSNLGNTVNHITLESASVEGFEFTITPRELTIAAFSMQSAKITINVSISRPFNQDNSIEILAISNDDPTQEASVSLRVNIGKSYGVKLSIDSEIRTQTIAPGESADFVITVENLGNAQATIFLSLEDAPGTWTGILDNSEISVPSGKSRYARLTLTAPSNAKNKDEARVTIRAEAGDSDFGDVEDEISATAVITADESGGRISSSVLFAGSFLVLLIIVGAFLFVNQRRETEGRGFNLFGSAFSGGAESPGTQATNGDTPRPLTGDTKPGKQQVTCPKCGSRFEVELPPGDKPTVKTMCIDCGEIFPFERKVPEPEVPAEKPPIPAPTEQNVSCPKCSSSFDVELPPGDKPTVRTMCIDCGEIFAFERMVPEPGVPAGTIPSTEGAEAIPAVPGTQQVTCPKCASGFDVELPPGDKPTVKTMCIECGEIFSLERAPPPQPPSLPSPDAQVDGPEGGEPQDGSERKDGHHRPSTPLPIQKPDEGDAASQPPSPPPGPTEPQAPPQAPIRHGDPTQPSAHGPMTSEPIRTRETREVPKETPEASGESQADGKPGEHHESHMAVPKVMKCPKCGRKVFLKGKEEKVKCIFCGTRIQIERRRKSNP